MDQQSIFQTVQSKFSSAYGTSWSRTDPILDYISSQHHQEEDMHNALQAYTVLTSPTPDTMPQWSIN